MIVGDERNIDLKNKAAVVRLAIMDDANEIAKIHILSWQAAYHGLIPDNYLDGMSLESRKKAWEKRIEEGRPPLLLVTEERVIGFLHFSSTRDEDKNPTEVAEVNAMYLSPLEWRQGFGSLLLDSALSEIRKLGFLEVTLWVMEENTHAQKFYAKMGFNITNSKQTETLTPNILLNIVRFEKIF
jgi:GNAT superfamily N-acetyltransferase